MTLSTSTLGIFQSDIILRTALIQGISDMRANPWLLDYVFASLKYDALTTKTYGEREIENAKKWFMETDIPVFMGYRFDEATFPCLTITLADSTEVENTLSDVHYDVVENWDGGGRVIAYGPFNPTAYDPATGLMTLPSSSFSVFPGMFVFDKAGVSHEILASSSDTLTLKAGTVADFTGATVSPAAPSYVVSLESAVFHEVYSLGAHVNKDSTHLTYLHSVLVFVLLRYRESLLEARGFERSSFSSSDFRKDDGFQNEIIYSRMVNLSGNVRQYWPKSKTRKIDGIGTLLRPSIGSQTAEPLEPGSVELLGDRDSLDWNATRQ